MSVNTGLFKHEESVLILIDYQPEMFEQVRTDASCCSFSSRRSLEFTVRSRRRSKHVDSWTSADHWEISDLNRAITSGEVFAASEIASATA